jgi:hypothetical protein
LLASLPLRISKPGIQIPLEDFLIFVEHAIANPVTRSILWVFLRTLPVHYDRKAADEIRKASFYKEFHASQESFWDYQIRDYSALFGIDPEPALSSPCKQAALAVAWSLHAKLERSGVWFPKVQRVKNVSKDTAVEAKRFIDKGITEITTLDLERIYYIYGEKVQGPCEMRSSWRYNELKPRVYYCQGGKAYWSSRHAKKFAVLLMDSIPTTETKRRTNPQFYLSHDMASDYVVVWDYYAFTTKLSELKHFLYYVARALEDTKPDELRLFDYREGVIRMDPADFLDEYNEAVNIQDVFSVEHLARKLGLPDDGSITYKQQNSGMLGIAGNIGFSTSLHGYVLLETLGPDGGVCVGDDAMGMTDDPQNTIIPQVSEMGHIHPEKFGISHPGDTSPFRFIKRAWFREMNNSFHVDELFNFPLPPHIDRDLADRDVFYDKEDKFFFSKRVAIAAGNLLWRVQNPITPISDLELSLIHEYLHEAYRLSFLPVKGCLPGKRCRQIGPFTPGDQFNFAVPSLCFNEFDPRIGDWLEFLLFRAEIQIFKIPILSEEFPYDKPVKGDVLYGVTTRFWQAMEDIGLVTIEEQFQVKDYLSDWDRDAFRKWIKKTQVGKLLCSITILEEIPSQFDEFFGVATPHENYDVVVSQM